MGTHIRTIQILRLNAFREEEVLPLLPTEIISSSKDEEEALNCEENDSVASQHKTTGSPLDLKHKRRVKSFSCCSLCESLILLHQTPPLKHEAAKGLSNVMGGGQ